MMEIKFRSGFLFFPLFWSHEDFWRSACEYRSRVGSGDFPFLFSSSHHFWAKQKAWNERKTLRHYQVQISCILISFFKIIIISFTSELILHTILFWPCSYFELRKMKGVVCIRFSLHWLVRGVLYSHWRTDLTSPSIQNWTVCVYI